MKHAIVITLKAPPASDLALLEAVLALNECRVTPDALLFEGCGKRMRRSIWLIVSTAVDEKTMDRLRELPDAEAVKAVPCEDEQMLPWPPIILRPTAAS